VSGPQHQMRIAHWKRSLRIRSSMPPAGGWTETRDGNCVSLCPAKTDFSLAFLWRGWVGWQSGGAMNGRGWQMLPTLPIFRASQPDNSPSPGPPVRLVNVT
jgi:hypothetical protein